MHNSAQSREKQAKKAIPFFETILMQVLPTAPSPNARRSRGRPIELAWNHLWFALIVSVLSGMRSYQALWRRINSQGLGPFPAVNITDDAIIKRLKQAGTQPVQELLMRLSFVLSRRLRPLLKGLDLAPFASEVLALDETTWDAVERHLPSLRAVPDGDRRLLPGKLAGRFNLRTQQWDLIQLRDDPVGNCKLNVLSLLEGVAYQALLLFDLGYFSFPFFDYLTQQHFWFISRMREGVRYQIVHPFYRHEGILDALVWLGSPSRNSSRTGHLLRLVRFWDGQGLRCYLTNQTDPLLLPMADIARLYARRWDIELAFLTLKEHLGLHHWWSAEPVLRKQQALFVLIVAQLVQALRLLIALEEGRDPFEISLPLLIEHLPMLIATREHPVVWVRTQGRCLGFFRPSSRHITIAPHIPEAELCFPPPDLPRTRLASYTNCPDRPHRPPRKTPERKPTEAKLAPLFDPPSLKQLSLLSPKQLRGLTRVDI